MDPDVHGRRFSAFPPSSDRSGLGDRFNSSVESKPPPPRVPRLVASSPPRIPSDAFNIVRTRAPVHLAFGKSSDCAPIYISNHPCYSDCLMLLRMCICVNDRAHENGTLPVCPSDVPRGGAVFVHLCVRCALVMFRVHAEDGEAQYDANAAHPFGRSALNIVRVRAPVHHAFDLSLMPCVCIRMGGWAQEEWHPSTTRPSDATVWAEWFRSSHHPVGSLVRRKTGRWPRRPTRHFMVHCDLRSSRIRRTSVVSRASNGRHHRTPGGPLAPMACPAEGFPQLELPSRSSRWRTQRLGVLTDSFRLIFRHTSVWPADDRELAADALSGSC
ncbi:hypothetical protein C8Q77DRAFT_1122707 [Trametes polyzona]|nr:hypothetical protein C8Q77DRAFT_1122707 [Trametes polyzona]